MFSSITRHSSTVFVSVLAFAYGSSFLFLTAVIMALAALFQCVYPRQKYAFTVIWMSMAALMAFATVGFAGLAGLAAFAYVKLFDLSRRNRVG